MAESELGCSIDDGIRRRCTRRWMGLTRNVRIVFDTRAKSVRGNGDQGCVPTRGLVRARLYSAVYAETFFNGAVDDCAGVDWIGMPCLALPRWIYR